MREYEERKTAMSQSREDYLKYIYEAGQGRQVSNKAISQGLKVSAPSVTEMITRLAQEGLVEYAPYQGVSLTDSGLEQAKALVRKHEIWEYFLMHHLHYDQAAVHDLAEILEHATPSHLADRLAAYIKFPEGDV